MTPRNSDPITRSIGFRFKVSDSGRTHPPATSSGPEKQLATKVQLLWKPRSLVSLSL
jgi:hypothetical protein